MAFWPRDERNLSTRNQETKCDYPFIESGAVGAATLSPESLKWTFMSNPQRLADDLIARRLICRNNVQVFPPTRACPAKLERTSVRRRAEQGANFLRVYLPDVEVAAELIREQLTDDITISRSLSRFDPHLGNLLEIFRTPDKSHFLFPTGETNCDLNSCGADFSDASKVVFRPQASPLFSFPTPIQHLSLSQNMNGDNLAVRTLGCLKVFSLKLIDDAEDLVLDEHSTFSRVGFADETVVDMKFSPSSSTLLTISHKGNLFECNFAPGTQNVTQLRQVDNSTISDIFPDFWRFSLDSNDHSKFIMSSKDILQFDSRARASTNIFSIGAGRHVFTAIEDVREENLLQACSTHDVLWVDLRYSRKPLLAYAHGREYDQYLYTTTITYPGQGPLLFLSCRSNGLTTIYDVSRTDEGIIRLNQPPYILSLSKGLYEKHTGQYLLADEIGLGLVRLSEMGGVDYCDIHSGHGERELAVRRSEKIAELSPTTPNFRSYTSSLGTVNYTEVDMHERYNALFNQGFLEPQAPSEESLDQMLHFFPHYMRNHESPIEHILTTYDIAFRAGNEPRYPDRADFLTESVLDSSEAYKAMREGRLSSQMVKAPWHKSIASTLHQLDKDFRSDPQELMEYLREFDLVGEEVPQTVRKLEQAACMQLTLDLALSCDIFSESTFSKPTDIGHTLETMTEALSLSGEPPQVEFGYLRPLAKRPPAPNMDDANPYQQLEMPLGVRLLLNEWDIGDLEEYIFRDPYGESELSGSKAAPVNELRDFVVQSQRPPSILASNAVPHVTSEIPRKLQPTFQSQEMMAHSSDSGEQVGSSKDLIISTQVVPGPFGGRPAVKKKVVKKRLGGF